MTRDERRRALASLRTRSDFSETPVEMLTAAIQEARQEQGDLREFIGRIAAEMNRKGMSFAKIAELTGMPNSTLYHLAKDYL